MTRQQVLITAAELHAAIDRGDPLTLLDVRWELGDPQGRAHYESAHIPTATYVDLDTELAAPATAEAGRHPLPAIADLQRAARGWGVTPDRPVVVYDNTGGRAAARAWWLLRWAGGPPVRLLDGGLGAWTAAGYATAAGAEPATPGEIELSAGHLPTLTADEAADLASAHILLDARPGERFRGEVEPIDSTPGHIPGARSAPAIGNLSADGLFLDDAELARLYAGLGVEPTEHPTVGVYCGSGVTAAHDVAALAILGVDAALYPGSWSAWSADPSRPVATGP
jgi:thiosulfate/3-mercaptopyruvate sulfurtransferase